MALLFANNASTVLAQGISATDTTLEVSPSAGAAFPYPEDEGDYFLSTLVGVDTSLEIIKVTARDNDTFTIERAQEGTTAKPFATGSIIENRLTAGSLKNLLNVTYASEDEVLAGTEANKAISPKTLKVTYNIGTDAAPNGIPMADSAGKIDPSWLPYGLATTLAAGMVERATDQEALDGTDTERYITPYHLKTVVSDNFSTTPGAGKIPVTDSDGKLGYSWLDISSFPVSSRTIKYIKSSTTWTVPHTGMYLFTLIGGGGKGSTYASNEGGGGGGGAGYIRRVQAFLTKNSTVPIVVGGAAGASKITIAGDAISAPAGASTGSGTGGKGSSGGGGGGGGVGQSSTQQQGGGGGGSGGGSGGSSNSGSGGAGLGGGHAGQSGQANYVKANGGAAVTQGSSFLCLSTTITTAPYLNFCKGGKAMEGGAGYGGGGAGERDGNHGPTYSGGGGGGGIVGDGLLNNSTTPAANQGIVVIDYLTPVQP